VLLAIVISERKVAVSCIIGNPRAREEIVMC
jgi:hypothetical protein